MSFASLTLVLAIALPADGLQAADPVLERLLRVPPSALSNGCRLATELDGPSTGLPPASNPWVGTDPRRIAEIRVRIGGIPPTPDGPPLDAAETRRFMRQLAKGIREGYTARYVQPDGRSPTIDAVLFGDRDDARTFAEAAASGRRGAVIIHEGLMVASIRGEGGCARSIIAHLQSRPKPAGPK